MSKVRPIPVTTVVVRALPDAHLGWSGPSRGITNKLATMDIIADYMERSTPNSGISQTNPGT